MNHDRILPGVLLMLAFCVLAPLLDVSSKLATETIPVGQVTLARFVVQAALMLPIALILRADWKMPLSMLGLVFARAFFLLLSTYCFIAAVSVMPIADALAIVFVLPFIVLLLGHLIFKDEVGPRRIAASLVGFGGAMLVIQPSFSVFGLVVLYPLGTALLFAFYMLITRAMSSAMQPVAMQLHTSLAGLVMCLPIVWLADGSGIRDLDPIWPQGVAWIWLFGVGFWAAISHLCMTYALRFAPSATIAPLQYLEIVMAVAMGYLVWGDFPDAWTWAGIAVIVGSGLYLIHRERLAAQAKARAAHLESPAEPIPEPIIV